MINLIDAMYEHRRSVGDATDEILYRARACRVIGLHDLADFLENTMRELDKSAQHLQGVHARELNQRVRDSEAASRSMLEGVLVGVIMGKEGR